jgi:hypothetical protein
MYAELLGGYTTDPIKTVGRAIFDIKYDEMVIVRDIEFYSLCEHSINTSHSSSSYAEIDKMFINTLVRNQGQRAVSSEPPPVAFTSTCALVPYGAGAFIPRLPV